MNLITHSSGLPTVGSIPLSLTLRPACGLPGDYECPTDSAALIKMLRMHSDLPGTVLQRFEDEIRSCSSAKLLGVELSESVLTQIGYFID